MIRDCAERGLFIHVVNDPYLSVCSLRHTPFLNRRDQRRGSRFSIISIQTQMVSRNIQCNRSYLNTILLKQL